MKWIFGFVFILAKFAVKCTSHSPELVIAIQTAVKYYNESMNLAEKVEIVEKYYKMEWEEGMFLSVKLQIVPETMRKIHSDLDSLQFDAKHRLPRDKKIARRIDDIEKELIDNYGPKDRNFRILKNDPLSQNLIAVNRMKSRVDELIKDFFKYNAVQKTFVETYKVIPAVSGIHLHPEGDSNIIMVTNDLNEMFKKFAKSENLKKDNVDINDDWEDIYDKFKITRDAPQQTSQEILALEGLLADKLVNPVQSQLLRGFIPELNKKTVTIMTKLKRLEDMMNSIDEESNKFIFFVTDKREELFHDLEELKQKFNSISTHEEL